MKKILYTLIICAGVLGFSACNDSEEDNSRLTYYVVFSLPSGEVLNGDTIEHPVNTPFTAPEYTATENGVDVKSKVSVTGVENVNPDRIGIYPIRYSANNSDGFASTATQTVYVVNPTVTTDLTGSYRIDNEASTCSVDTLNFENVLSIDVEKIATGIFSVSDFLGGLYEQQEGLGGDYAAAANVNLVQAISDNESSTFDFLNGNTIELDTEEAETVTVTNFTATVTATGYRLTWDAAFDGNTLHIVANKEVE